MDGGGAVQDERAGEAGVEHADAAGDRNDVGEVTERVRQHQRRDGHRLADGEERHVQDGDVEPEVTERSDQPPVPAGGGIPRLLDPGDDVDDPVRAGAAAPHERGQREHGQRGGARQQHRQSGEQEVVRSGDAGEQQRPGDDHGGGVDPARQEEQSAGAPDDPAGGLAGQPGQPAADRVTADASAREQRSGGLGGPAQGSGVVAFKAVEEQPVDDDEADVGGKLERDRGRDPERVDALDRSHCRRHSGEGEQQ